MSEYIKKASMILGHAVCIFILIYSFAANRETVKGEVLQITEEEQMVTAIPTEVPQASPTPVVAPTVTVVSVTIPTQAPTITVAPTATPEPTATVTPTATPEPTATPIPTVNPEEARAEVKNRVLQNIADNAYASLDNTNGSWWFRRKNNHVPSGSGEIFKIAAYEGFYINTKATEEDKVLYLTLDCGYGSSNTDTILDVFKKHEIKATFFVTGNYMKACPEEVKRMVAEGHTVANHSATHTKLTKLTEEEIYQEIISCEEKFYEITGTQMAMYFRPPEGAYSKRTMQITKDLGYKTIFWSLAYNDYDKKNQPGKEYVLDHFETYHHNGAIPLMHNDSDSNMEAMDGVITFLKAQGYRFGTLDELK